MGPRLLPKEQYGQFCSANAMIWHIGFDGADADVRVTHGHVRRRRDFRLVLRVFERGNRDVWLVYRLWKALGGDKDYRPPVVYEQPPPDPAQLVAERV
jgi:hypothetical protein